MRSYREKYFLLLGILCTVLLIHHFSRVIEDNELDQYMQNLKDTSPIDPRLLPVSILKQPKEGLCKHLKFIVMVHTSVPMTSQRNFWRNFGASLKSQYNFNIFFPIGAEDPATLNFILNEAKQFEDLLVLDFKDSYRNLTTKHINGLRYYLKVCDSSVYILKIDDDIALGISSIYNYINSMNIKESQSISCYRHDRPHARRNPNSKWFTTPEEFAPSLYPDYCSGMAYIASYSTIQRLLQATEFSYYLWIDDLYVTGILRFQAGIDIIPLNRRYFIDDPNDEISQKFLRSSENQLKGYYFILTNRGNQQRLSYLLNN